MQLQIQHTWPLLGMETTPGALSIEITRAQLQITTEPIQVVRSGEPFRVEINSYPCRAEVGLKNDADLIKEAADRGYAALLEGIGRRAEEGDRLAAIQDKGNPIAEIAANLTLAPPAQFNIALLPISKPEINFVGGETASVRPGTIEITATPGSLAFDYRRGSLQIYMRQVAELKMEFVGSKLDMQG